MDYSIEKMQPFKVIGFERVFTNETGYKEIPEFWKEVFKDYENNLCQGKAHVTDIEKAIVENKIGELGLCIDDIGDCKTFRYLICGFYHGGNIPEGLKVVELEAKEWAKFEVVGPIPTALQTINTKIFKEWLPGNEKYKLDGMYNIEWYSLEGNSTDNDYHSGIWLPVKRI